MLFSREGIFAVAKKKKKHENHPGAKISTFTVFPHEVILKRDLEGRPNKILFVYNYKTFYISSKRKFMTKLQRIIMSYYLYRCTILFCAICMRNISILQDQSQRKASNVVAGRTEYYFKNDYALLWQFTPKTGSALQTKIEEKWKQSVCFGCENLHANKFISSTWHCIDVISSNTIFHTLVATFSSTNLSQINFWFSSFCQSVRLYK